MEAYREVDSANDYEGSVNIPCNDTDSDSHQTAQGCLKNDNHNWREIHDVRVIPVEAIQHYLDIPDFLTKTSSELPIVVLTAESYQCIDGWEKVDGSNGMIECRVIELPEDRQNFVEVALQKCASRCSTTGGSASYTELILAAKSAFKILMSSNCDLTLYTCGGRRKAGEFNDDVNENVYTVLSSRMDRDRDTVRKYVKFSEYIDNETLKTIASSSSRKITKRFFESFSSSVKKEIKKLEEEKRAHNEIEKIISERVLDFLEYWNNGKKSDSNESNSDDNSISEPTEQPTNVDLSLVKHKTVELVKKGQKLAEEIESNNKIPELYEKVHLLSHEWHELETMLQGLVA